MAKPHLDRVPRIESPIVEPDDGEPRQGGLSQTETARVMGISQQLVSVLEARALAKMRAAFGSFEDWIP